MKEGESVIRVQDYKDVRCNECQGWIPAGQSFLLDMIPMGHGGRYAHKLHEAHWKGRMDVIVDRTDSNWGRGFKQWKNRTYEKRRGKNY